MTPDDIRSQRFSTRLLQGLSPEEVSAFLEDVAAKSGASYIHVGVWLKDAPTVTCSW